MLGPKNSQICCDRLRCQVLWRLSEQKTLSNRCFLAPRKPKTTAVFTIFFVSGRKTHGIYSVFWTVPSKNTGIYVVFSTFQDSFSMPTAQDTVNYNVLVFGIRLKSAQKWTFQTPSRPFVSLAAKLPRLGTFGACGFIRNKLLFNISWYHVFTNFIFYLQIALASVRLPDLLYVLEISDSCHFAQKFFCQRSWLFQCQRNWCTRCQYVQKENMTVVILLQHITTKNWWFSCSFLQLMEVVEGPDAGVPTIRGVSSASKSSSTKPGRKHQ